MSNTYLPIGIRMSFIGLSLCESSIINLVFSIVPFMVEFYFKDSYSGIVPEDIISRYSGYLEGIFRLMQFFSSIWMSMLSDKIGRKVVTIGALFMNFACSIALGLCTTFEAAFYVRIISGLFAGSMSITKSMIREVTDDTNISALYGSFALGIGLANSLGPFMAGLSKPADSLGGIFDCDFFRTYPYFLPLVLHSFLCLITLLVVLYCLPSTKLKTEKSQGFSSLFNNKLYLYSVSIYGLISISNYGFRLVFSLICKSGENLGGMGIDSEDKVSIIQGFAGIFVLILPPLLTPVISMKIGLVKSLVWISIIIVPSFFVVYACRELDGMWKYAALAAFYGINNSSFCIFIFYISICISNTVTSDVLGAANGLSQALIGVCRFASASMFGIIYGWSVTSGLSYPLIDASFSCLVMSLLVVFEVILIINTLDLSVEHKKTKTQVESPLLDINKK